VEGETTYTVDEAAAILQETPDRVRELLATGELEGIPPGATVSREWKVFLPTNLGQEPDQASPVEEPTDSSAEEQALAAEEVPERPQEEDQDEGPADSPSDELEEHADLVSPPAASDAAVLIGDEASDETDEDVRSSAGGSGWTTTKQAAKVLSVSRRSVQGYVRRGLLDAREEGGGVNKRFLVSIDSLNALRDQRKREAGEATKFAEASVEEEQKANLYANTGEALRHAIDRVEARTAEATELRIRLEITEKAESTLRAELEETRQRQADAERERDELRREVEALRERRESPVSPGPSETPTEGHGGSQEAREATQSAAETLRGPEPRPTASGPGESPQMPSQAGRRRGRLWRRVFGG
jgi:hypothetical protein